jgi:hypothetical protein
MGERREVRVRPGGQGGQASVGLGVALARQRRTIDIGDRGGRYAHGDADRSALSCRAAEETHEAPS